MAGRYPHATESIEQEPISQARVVLHPSQNSTTEGSVKHYLILRRGWQVEEERKKDILTSSKAKIGP